jgi:putative ABC transport system permease protein
MARAVFRRLLRLYPAWFREAYGEEMTHLFMTRLGRVRGTGARLALWWRTLRDTAWNAAALRSEHLRGDTIPMETLLSDARHTVRRLVRAPVFTLGVAALLAVGIGANTTVFTLVDALILRPPPWEQPERVVHIYQDSDDGEPNANSFPATQDMARSDVFEAVAATTTSSAAWEGPDGPEPVATEYTTSNYLAVLGLQVQRGRWFAPEEDVVGAPLVAVVSAATWHGRFASDPGVVGRTVRLNGQPVTIVGVGPERLTSTMTPLLTDFWLSISSTPVSGPFQVSNLERREDHWYLALGRLASGVTVPQAQSAMDALSTRLAEEYPELNRGRGITVFASGDVHVHPQGDATIELVGTLLSAIALTVLLLACANLANLLLVRGLGRSGEMAVRSALGAPRRRVARLFLIESTILALLGGLGGLVLTWWVLAALPALPLADVLGQSVQLDVDLRVISFAAALVLGTGVLFGLAPALRATRADVSRTLRDDRRTSSSDRGTTRLRRVLVAAQVAASLVLVLATGLLARSLAALQSVETGVDIDHVAYVRLDWTRSGLQGDEMRAAVDELRTRLASVPGVREVALSARLPAQSTFSTTTEVEGYTPPAGTSAVELPFSAVTDEYFEAMGIPLLAGRSFGQDDVPDSGETSILVSEAAARRFWGTTDAIGRRMRGQGSDTWSRPVVGVVGDVPVNSIGEPPTPMIYFSTRQMALALGYLIIRSDGEPGAVLEPVRRQLAAWRPSVSVSEQGTLASHFGASLALPRLAARAMGAFSALALLLAGLGIYTVVSFTVARRWPELSVRIALGAERSGVVRMVVMDVARVAGAGLALGMILSVLAASRLGDVLFGVPALDPVSFGGAVVLMLAVTWVAAYIPARRAVRADPADALRAS